MGRHVYGSADPQAATALASSAGGIAEIVFSQPAGQDVALGMSGIYDVPASKAKTYTEIRLTLTVAGTTASSVEVFKNGTTTGTTASIAGSATEAAPSVSVAFAAHDNIAVRCPTVGTGAQGITVMIR